MLNIYLTTVPLQGKFDLEKIAYGSTLPGGESIQTRFPILQVIHDTMQPNDSAQVLVIRQKNADTARNYTYLLEELTAQGIPEDKVVQIALPEKQDPATLVGLCRDVADALPQVGRVYACITYGTNVKEVTTQVSEAAVDCGIIYQTDAFSAKLTVVDTATAEMCGQVIYPAAVLNVSQNQEAAKAFLEYLTSDAADAVFEEVGFTPIG